MTAESFLIGDGMTSSKDLKRQLREQALARRDSLDPFRRVEAAMIIAETLRDAADIGPGAVVSGFWPMRSEVDVRPAMFALREKGARLCLPAILDKTTIVFRELLPSGTMIDMGFGTQGPGEDAHVLDPTLMLIPLAAFDRRGHRVGYGAGYYDRAIAALHAKNVAPRLIGVAFDCQEVALVPDEPHDVALSEILTESGLRQVGGLQQTA